MLTISSIYLAMQWF